MRFWVVAIRCLSVAAVFVGIPAEPAASLELNDDLVMVNTFTDDDVIKIYNSTTTEITVEINSVPEYLPAGNYNIKVSLGSGTNIFVIDPDVEYNTLTVEGGPGQDTGRTPVVVPGSVRGFLGLVGLLLSVLVRG